MKYYKLVDGNWYLYDGENLPQYNYNITGNTLVLNLDKVSYNVTVSATTTGDVVISATHSEYNTENGMETSRITKYLKNVNALTEQSQREIVESKIEYHSSNYVEDGENSYFKFNVGETINSKEGEILLKITYKESIVNNFLKTVYVIASDTMVKNNSFVTTFKDEITKPATLWYESKEFTLPYRVFTAE